ncbi:MAG: peptidase M28 [Acidobacteria bacterium 13_2_20CM_57_17]|nr:MAG: peptidase M28 [Acidobacteria bacterium 13_2_20CM_57_17]OLE16110.1 MAG: peptidase M28 [Acidobacteria bacterium 13_1_20CM_4_57_11]
MNSSASQSAAVRTGTGAEMHRLITDLYPICRSITGKGLRETLRAVGRVAPLTLHEVPTGTQVFDWTVPQEWNIRDAYVMNSRGERVIDFQTSNLHVVNYSVPVHRKMRLAELKTHLFTLPDRPDWIPYRTSYYKEDWGFCLSQRQLEFLPDDEYEVVIDSTLQPGHLTYGECFLPGELPDEIIVSAHCCHPSMCNDNLSGIAVAAFLAKHLSSRPHRYSYRFLFIPGTIGAITWLALNEEKVPRIRHGLVLTGLGDSGKLHYKRSRRGNAEIDRAAAHLLRHASYDHHLLDFSPYGYDERQFCSPGINLPVGRLSRTPHGTFPEYHTSADNLGFVHPEKLEESFDACLQIMSLLERNGTFLNLNSKCEPQLGRRGLYGMVGGGSDAGVRELAMLWVLNLSDGNHSLLDITERSNMAFDSICAAAEALQQKGLLRECCAFETPEPAESFERTKS